MMISIVRDPGVTSVRYSLKGPGINESCELKGAGRMAEGQVTAGQLTAGQLTFTPRKSGRYLYRAWTSDPSEVIERAIDVDRNFEEFAAPEEDRELLEQLATLSGGRVVKADELGELPKHWKRKNEILRRETRDIWDHPFAFGLLAVLFATEWHLRRRWNAMYATM